MARWGVPCFVIGLWPKCICCLIGMCAEEILLAFYQSAGMSELLLSAAFCVLACSAADDFAVSLLWFLLPYFSPQKYNLQDLPCALDHFLWELHARKPLPAASFMCAIPSSFLPFQVQPDGPGEDRSLQEAQTARPV